MTLVLACASGVARAQAENADPRLARALSYLDGDAGLVFSIRVSELQSLQERWVASLPEQKGTSDLAALGAIAILGFHPLQTNAWQAIGIDTNAKLVAQVAAIDRQLATAADRSGGNTLWRTRILLPVNDLALATRGLSNMRLRDRARLSEPSEQALLSLLGVHGDAAPRVVRKLQRAGVFMLGRPAPMDGLIVASVRDDLIVIDWLAAYGPEEQVLRWSKHEAALMTAITRRPAALQLDMPGAQDLIDYQVGMWIRPGPLGSALSAAEVDGLNRKSVVRRHRRCEPFRILAQQSSFAALSVGLDLSPSSVDLQLRWHLGSQSNLIASLPTQAVSMVRDEATTLEAVVHLSDLSALRGRKRAPVAATWDQLWNKASACGRGASAFALAVAWPEIAGLFLDELAALDPSAHQVVSNMGSASLSVSGDSDSQHIVAEAWVRKPGNLVAAKWLAALFGSPVRQDDTTSWGVGKMQPYAIRAQGGSTVGVGLRPNSRQWALAAEREEVPASALLTIAAQPAKLSGLLLELPWLRALQSFARADASFRVEPGALHFKLHLDQD